jgi:uncharacterized protein YbjT (DUF2867 family)
MNEHMVFVIAGASGFIGQTIKKRLKESYPGADIYSLSRRDRKSPCDLFSAESLEKVLPKKIDYAFYFVHSMGPTASLDQGTFEDYDLLMADNFARACEKRQTQQLIYLGGLVPESLPLSSHLRSRREVEQIFTARTFALTSLRAGLIVGQKGSSYQILLKLIKRLPVLVCPKWTQTLSSPCSLEAMGDALMNSIGNPKCLNKTFDVSDCTPLTYLEMMKATANYLGVKRFFLRVPFFSPRISRLWVRLVTGTSSGLVYPLVESLSLPMRARPDYSFPGLTTDQSFRDLLNKGKDLPRSASTPSEETIQDVTGPSKNDLPTVRSVQRFELNQVFTAIELREKYLKWLSLALGFCMKVERTGPKTSFILRGANVSLLEFVESKLSSDSARDVLLIRGGILAAPGQKGRLEFRTFFGGKLAVVAIHDFTPALPWYIYRCTQAPIHLMVMKYFGKALR